MAKIIEDGHGARKIIMEFNEAEAALIGALLGRCNASRETNGLYATFDDLNLPVVDITDIECNKPNLRARRG